MSKDKFTIIPIDEEHAIGFPKDEDFVEEHEDGTMSLLVDIYKIVDGKTKSMEKGSITPEIHAKVEAFVNEMISQALDYEKYEKRLKK